MPETPDLPTRLRAATRFADFRHVPVCESTQDLAGELETDGVVWADEQLSGRGRLGREWHGAPARDVEVTYRITTTAVPDPTIVAAMLPAAIAAAVERHAGQPIRMKWPNDLLCGGRKIAGILIDAAGNPPARYLIGIGVNVNRTSFPPDLAELATSMAVSKGATVDRECVVFDLGEAIERAFADLEAGRLDRLEREFCSRLGFVGKKVRGIHSGEEFAGRLTSLDLRTAEIDGQKRIHLATTRSIEIAE